MIKRQIAKDSWRINLPSELVQQLGWNKGDIILFEIKDNKLIAIKGEEEKEAVIPKKKEKQTKTEEVRRYANGKRIPSKKTPCGLFEFTKKKYVENKCKKCNANYELLMNHPDIHCPIAEENYKTVCKEVCEEIKENYENENSDIDPEIIKQMKDRYKELSGITIQFLSNVSDEDKIKYSRQMECPLCGNEMIQNSGIIRNGELVCLKCKKKVINEIKEACELKRELKKGGELK